VSATECGVGKYRAPPREASDRADLHDASRPARSALRIRKVGMRRRVLTT
jgi:hypothetical protein